MCSQVEFMDIGRGAFWACWQSAFRYLCYIEGKTRDMKNIGIKQNIVAVIFVGLHRKWCFLFRRFSVEPQIVGSSYEVTEFALQFGEFIVFFSSKCVFVDANDGKG